MCSKYIIDWCEYLVTYIMYMKPNPLYDIEDGYVPYNDKTY